MSKNYNTDAVKFAEEIKKENPTVEKWLDNLGEPKKEKRKSFIDKIISFFSHRQ